MRRTQVSLKGFHQRRQHVTQNKSHRRRVSNAALMPHIKAIHAQVKGEYGWSHM
jgi:putative transposase